MSDSDPGALVDVHGVSLEYRGLRPLRIDRLILRAGDVLALAGFDEITAEMLVNLLIGAVLPDTGDVQIVGRSTADIADSAEWLALVDRFGLVSDRVVLLDDLTVVQNLAVPFTLEIDPVPDDVARDARRLGDEVALPAPIFEERVRDTSRPVRWRIRLARALALDPAVLLLEHPGASLAATDMAPLGALLAGIASSRRLAVLTLAADRQSVEALGGRLGIWNAVTGVISSDSFWTRWRSR
jgi:ABC-type transporter Mla maintaining outer membrane lipid asymmetry ATPase subunit MlaF